MSPSTRFRALSVLGILAAAAGCTLVNGFDDVKQPFEPEFVPGSRSAPASPPDSAAPPEDAGDAEAPAAKEIVVVGGEVESAPGVRSPVLAVLDTATGAQVGDRVTMHVAGIGYDAPRDVWYVFEAPSHFNPTPSDVVKLHIRKLDRATGAWTELANVEVPPIASYGNIAVTTERLTYVAHDAEASVGSMKMVTLNTSNAAAPFVMDSQIIAPPPSNMLAVRSTSGPGGQITLVNTGRAADGDCAGYPPQHCSAKLRRFLIPNSGAPFSLGAPITFGVMQSFGLPAAAVVTCGGNPDEVVVTPNAADGGWKAHTIGYQSSTSAEKVQFAMNPNASFLRAAAIDDARRVMFLVEGNNDTNVYALPLDVPSGMVKAPLRHSGQAVYYDPTSQTVFAPFNQGDGFTFSAFRVSGTAAALQLKERTSASDWTPPADLRPILLGIRQPPVPTCP